MKTGANPGADLIDCGVPAACEGGTKVVKYWIFWVRSTAILVGVAARV